MGVVSDMSDDLKMPKKHSGFTAVQSISACQFASFFDASSKFSTRSAQQHIAHYRI